MKFGTKIFLATDNRRLCVSHSALMSWCESKAFLAGLVVERKVAWDGGFSESFDSFICYQTYISLAVDNVVKHKAQNANGGAVVHLLTRSGIPAVARQECKASQRGNAQLTQAWQLIT